MVSFTFILNSTGILFLTEYLRRKFPSQYDIVMTEFYFAAIFLYTKCEVLVKNTLKKITNRYPDLLSSIKKKMADFNIFAKKEPEYIVEMVKNGEVVIGFTEEQIADPNFTLPQQDGDAYDFFIFCDYQNSLNGCIGKIIGRNFTDLNLVSVTSSVKFILAEITIGLDSEIEKSIKVSFCTDEYNYLMVNNVIDKKFMQYFLKKHYNSEIGDNDRHLLQSYKLTLIDGNVKVTTLDQTHSLIINEFGFSSSCEVINDAVTFVQ